jgi:hypothetical protein
LRRLGALLFGRIEYLISPTAPFPPSRRSAVRPATIQNARSSTSLSRYRGISPSSRPCRSTRRSRSQACRSACRSSAPVTTTTVCSSSRKPGRPHADRSRTGRRPPN